MLGSVYNNIYHLQLRWFCVDINMSVINDVIYIYILLYIFIHNSSLVMYIHVNTAYIYTESYET